MYTAELKARTEGWDEDKLAAEGAASDAIQPVREKAGIPKVPLTHAHWPLHLWGSCRLDVESRESACPLPHHLGCAERVCLP